MRKKLVWFSSSLIQLMPGEEKSRGTCGLHDLYTPGQHTPLVALSWAAAPSPRSAKCMCG